MRCAEEETAIHEIAALLHTAGHSQQANGEQLSAVADGGAAFVVQSMAVHGLPSPAHIAAARPVFSGRCQHPAKPGISIIRTAFQNAFKG